MTQSTPEATADPSSKNEALSGTYVPSASEWVRAQVETYERTGGQEASTLLDTGIPVIIVTMRGAKTGDIRKIALMRVEHRGDYAVVASAGGAPKHPVWYWNLTAHPDEALIQDGPKPVRVSVREVEGDERAAWWDRAVAVYPPYAEYQEKTDRVIPYSSPLPHDLTRRNHDDGLHRDASTSKERRSRPDRNGASAMKYRNLPGTGISVSNLALGTMGFATETEQGEAFEILDRFVEADGNLVDTANVYGGGLSEEVLGRWFASRPAEVTDRVVLATKARFGTGPDTNEAGSTRRNLDRALSASLRRLGRENVDLYQLHGWDPLTPIEEMLGFLDDAVHAGKIHYIGLSNFTGWQMQLTLSTAKAMGLQVPVTLQPQYSLVSREIEFEIVPAALHNNVGLLPWSPLGGGFLSGKYSKNAEAESETRAGSGVALYNHIFDDLRAKDQNWATLETVHEIAKEIGATPSQVALSWVTNRPGVTAPIFGARTLQQLEDNLIAADLDLGKEATDRLDNVSAPTSNDYPYGPFGVKQRDRYVDSSDQAIRELTQS